ncbi:hypothetical protein QBC39DRAFT_184582 [Podospora conica]|nr:hypothetical protein QBC39DRAFT_184582 [Schizothecium conicum]
MSTKDRRPNIACVEDADDFDEPIHETARYAASVYTSSVASPVKEKPNTSRARRDKKKDSTSPLTDSDSTIHPHGDLVKRSKSIVNSHNHKKAIIPSPISRPPAKQMRTAPTMRKQDEASYYGVSPTITTAASSRPRGASRPQSYYPPSNSNASYYPHPPPAAVPTSYPPPSWTPSNPSPYPPPSVASHQSQQAHDYFSSRQIEDRRPEDRSSRPLEDRFGPGGRPQSSIGFRPVRNSSYGEFEDALAYGKTVARRPSVSQRRGSRLEHEFDRLDLGLDHDHDRRAMPPPQRPQTTRPTSQAFRPPPPSTPSHRRTTQVFEEEHALFQDISPHQPQPTYKHGTSMTRSKSRRPTVGHAAASYDSGEYRTEVAGAKHARRHSYYGNKSASSGSGYEDQVRLATRYQEETGAPPGTGMQLTAETLRKAGRSRGPESRRSRSSTRSSESRDESDFRQSATTRTTRSSNDEDFTIFVKGGSATLKVGGAEMKCKDGTEINIASRNIPPPSFRTTSDRSSNYLEDERRPRIGPASRARTSSQSGGSFSRSLPKYDLPMGSHGYGAGSGSYYQNPPHQHIPPYPSYPTYPNAEEYM